MLPFIYWCIRSYVIPNLAWNEFERRDQIGIWFVGGEFFQYKGSLWIPSPTDTPVLLRQRGIMLCLNEKGEGKNRSLTWASAASQYITWTSICNGQLVIFHAFYHISLLFFHMGRNGERTAECFIRCFVRSKFSDIVCSLAKSMTPTSFVIVQKTPQTSWSI